MKEYEFKVSFGEGKFANGTIIVNAEHEGEATDLALDYVFDKLEDAFPELDIEASVTLAEVYDIPKYSKIYQISEKCFGVILERKVDGNGYYDFYNVSKNQFDKVSIKDIELLKDENGNIPDVCTGTDRLINTWKEEMHDAISRWSDVHCNCSECKNSCIHHDAFRRLPKEIGGLGLCENIQKDS